MLWCLHLGNWRGFLPKGSNRYINSNRRLYVRDIGLCLHVKRHVSGSLLLIQMNFATCTKEAKDVV